MTDVIRPSERSVSLFDANSVSTTRRAVVALTTKRPSGEAAVDQIVSRRMAGTREVDVAVGMSVDGGVAGKRIGEIGVLSLLERNSFRSTSANSGAELVSTTSGAERADRRKFATLAEPNTNGRNGSDRVATSSVA